MTNETNNDKRKKAVSNILEAERVLSLLSNDMASEFQQKGMSFPAKAMEDHAEDRAALLRVRRILLDVAEKIHSNAHK